MGTASLSYSGPRGAARPGEQEPPRLPAPTPPTQARMCLATWQQLPVQFARDARLITGELP